jgi:hypothetical protein
MPISAPKLPASCKKTPFSSARGVAECGNGSQRPESGIIGGRSEKGSAIFGRLPKKNWKKRKKNRPNRDLPKKKKKKKKKKIGRRRRKNKKKKKIFVIFGYIFWCFFLKEYREKDVKKCGERMGVDIFYSLIWFSSRGL